MSAPDALVASLMEIERHVAGLGWDQPARLFALVPTVELIEAEPQLAELERHGLLAPRRGTGLYNRDAVTIAVAARKMATYGMDVRHLRAIKQAAAREAALIEQAVGAHGRRRPGSRQALIDVMQLVMYAHTAMLRSSITS